MRHWQIILGALYDSIQAKIFHINDTYAVRQKNPLFSWHHRTVSVEVRYKSDNRFQLAFDNLQNVEQI